MQCLVGPGSRLFAWRLSSLEPVATSRRFGEAPSSGTVCEGLADERPWDARNDREDRRPCRPPARQAAEGFSEFFWKAAPGSRPERPFWEALREAGMGGLQGPKCKFWLDTCLELVETSTRFGFGVGSRPPVFSEEVSRAPVFLFVSSTRVDYQALNHWS